MESEHDVFDISKLKFLGDFEQQVSDIIDYIHLKREAVLRFDGLVNDLYNLFGPIWGDISIHPYGSIVTGLGIRTSDVDCYIQLPPWQWPQDKAHVINAKKILMHQKHIFRDVFAIVNAKVPIVQCYHIPTQSHCDISFNSSLAVANSKLLAYLLNLNKNALQLALLVKYWSKIHNLTGTNLMSSYCMTLMVIFFLQQINLLHSVEDLQKDVDEFLINEWNSAFNSSVNLNWNNNKSLYELLGEFFKFYKNFDFDKYIVSPYLGRQVSKDLFTNVKTVPQNFYQYKINVNCKKIQPFRLDAALCIQDPFEHNKNCGLSVYKKLAIKITAKIQKAASIYETESESNFLKELLRSPPDNGPTEKIKKNHALLSRVRKNYRLNQNMKHIKQNFRQNYRGRNQGNWRGKRGIF